MQILPALTTITPDKWRQKLKELKKLKLKEIALFLTCLEQKERKELYQLLKETKIEKIPLVHLRSDMELWEFDYLIKNYQTKVFNTHTQREHLFLYNYRKYQKLIYIENTYESFDEQEIKEFAGICLDFAHLESDRLLNQDIYQYNIKMIEKYGIGCGHVSVIKATPTPDEKSKSRHSSHYLENLSELDYLKNYPLKYFKTLIAIELENSLEEQLKAKEYIINLLNLKK